MNVTLLLAALSLISLSVANGPIYRADSDSLMSTACFTNGDPVFHLSNAQQCDSSQDIDSKFRNKDIYYNGTISVGFTGGSGNCTSFGRANSVHKYLRLGQMTLPGSPSISRHVYDTNPFFLEIASDVSDPPAASLPYDVNLVSSSSEYVWAQYWNLTSAKNAAGNGFDITGGAFTTHFSKNSYFAHSPTTDCPDLEGFFYASSNATLTGAITATEAVVTVTVLNVTYFKAYSALPVVGQFRTVFRGTWWAQGPALVTVTQDIETNGGTVQGDSSGTSGAYIENRPYSVGSLLIFTFVNFVLVFLLFL